MMPLPIAWEWRLPNEPGHGTRAEHTHLIQTPFVQAVGWVWWGGGGGGGCGYGIVYLVVAKK